jgi:hypothetical protein
MQTLPSSNPDNIILQAPSIALPITTLKGHNLIHIS